MIGLIGSDCDIRVFLEDAEVPRLKKEVLEGVLIKFFKPKLQGKVYLSVNDKKKNYQGIEVGVEDKNYWGKKEGFEVELFMGSDFYKYLVANNSVGTRHKMLDGAKVRICKRAEDELLVEHLEHYRDNKEKLHPELG
jgi:hypothetical protein